MTSATSNRNHAPHIVVLNARMRLTAGLATRMSSGHGMPNQKSIPNRMPIKTIPVPRSG
jgi:hypothetical protein